MTNEGQLAKPANKQLATIDYAADAGEGCRIGQDLILNKDIRIPKLKIVQSGSPFRKRTNEAFIPGAEEGMIIDLSNRDLYDGAKGIYVIPCKYLDLYEERQPAADPRKQGDLIGIHPYNADIVRGARWENKRQVTKAGTILYRTLTYYVLLLKDIDTLPIKQIMIQFKSTQLQKGLNWNQMFPSVRIQVPGGKAVEAPLYSQTYHITTVLEKNQENEWYGWKTDYFYGPDGEILKDSNGRNKVVHIVQNAEIYQAARQFYHTLTDGLEKIISQQLEDTGEEEKAGAAEPDLEGDVF